MTYEEREQKLLERKRQVEVDNISYQEYLAVQLNELGEECQEVSYHERAINCFTHAIELYQNILELDPSNLIYQEGLAHSNLLKAESLTDLSQYNSALDVLLVSNDLFRKCLQQESNNLKYKAGIALACTLFSQCYLALGRSDEAWEANEEGILQWKSLCNDWPEEHDCQMGLAGVLLLSMEMAQTPDKKKLVVPRLKEGHSLVEKLCRVANKELVAEAQKVLATFQLALGMHYAESLLEQDKAREYLEEAKSLSEILILENPDDAEMQLIHDGILEALDELG